MKARSPSARRAARARATSEGSLAGGSSPGQLTPRSAAGSAPAPSTSSGSERPGLVASVRSVWLGDVVMAAPIPRTYRLSDDTHFILAEAGKLAPGRGRQSRADLPSGRGDSRRLTIGSVGLTIGSVGQTIQARRGTVHGLRRTPGGVVRNQQAGTIVVDAGGPRG